MNKCYAVVLVIDVCEKKSGLFQALLINMHIIYSIRRFKASLGLMRKMGEPSPHSMWTYITEVEAFG